jgi:hypothetical protein
MPDVNFVLTPMSGYEITSITDTEDDMTKFFIETEYVEENGEWGIDGRWFTGSRNAAIAAAKEEAKWESTLNVAVYTECKGGIAHIIFGVAGPDCDVWHGENDEPIIAPTE